MLEDSTLREVFHIRVSGWGALSVIFLAFILLMVVLSLLIVYTPIRNVLPGYSESLRQQIIVESARVDSLQASLAVQRQYLDIIKQLAVGEVPTDSVQRLDSLQLVQGTQILEQRNEVTETFLAQYEQKERDRLMLFDNSINRNVRQLYRPVRGVVVRSAQPDLRLYSISVKTAKNENVQATMRGKIVLAERMADNTFTIMLQNSQFVTIYRHVPKVLKHQGAQVERGESLGLMDGEHELELELWDSGTFVNPEEVIVW